MQVIRVTSLKLIKLLVFFFFFSGLGIKKPRTVHSNSNNVSGRSVGVNYRDCRSPFKLDHAVCPLDTSSGDPGQVLSPSRMNVVSQGFYD